ncbi:MAG: tyrosine-type recombinase/integrase [Methanotrichaceae archaeon]|nr:tyrosine-type recombinase/integrase [Methanotrichaceae archaeon]
MVISLIERFESDCIIRNISGSKIYILYAQEFSNFLQKSGKEPTNITKGDLKAYLANLKARGLKQTSIDRIFSCLSSFYAFLVDEGLSSSNPITPFRRRYLRKYKEDNSSDSRKIIDIEQASILVNSILDSRDKAIVTLLFKTGMRRGELCRLDVGDIDLDNMSLKLKRTAKRSNRVLFFDRETAEVLRIWLRVRDARKMDDVALFPSRLRGRMSLAQIENIVKRHAARVGLHNSNSKCLEDRFTPHCCRHWFTTYLIRSGMPRDFVKELRGDVRRDAIDIYNHIDKKELKESYLAHIPQLGI